jgi:hypothetical protein
MYLKAKRHEMRSTEGQALSTKDASYANLYCQMPTSMILNTIAQSFISRAGLALIDLGHNRHLPAHSA